MSVPGLGGRNPARFAEGVSTNAANLMIAQLLRFAAVPASVAGGSSDAAEHLLARISSSEASNLRVIFGQLSAVDQSALRRRFGARLEEFFSISEERDPELRSESLGALARRAQVEDDAPTAAAIWNQLANHGTDSVRIRAARELSVLQGQGSFGERFEFLSRGFARQASDPRLIVGMGVASWVSGLVRLGTLSRLVATPTANFMTRGFGASALASSAAWFAEVPAFWATDRALRAVTSSEPLSWDARTVGQELGSLGMMLGLLRLGGAASNGLFRGVQGRVPLDSFSRFSQGAISQFGSLAGIYLDHRLEARLGWRPDAGAAAALFDSLATLVQFHVGGRLAAEALGPRFTSWQQQVEMQADLLSQSYARRFHPEPPGNFSLTPEPAFSAEGIPRSRPLDSEDSSPWRNQIAMMASLRPTRSRGTRSGASTPSSPKSEALVPAETLLAELHAAPIRGRDRLLKKAHANGRLAALALAQEAQGLRPQLSETEFARARQRLEDLETRFWLFLNQGREQLPREKRWERFQAWQNELYPADVEGLSRLQRTASSLGIRDVFALKADGIRLKSRVRASQQMADYFFDLSLVRAFLREENLHRIEESSKNGMFLSHLLLNGDGNCVSLSLLFAHFAGLAGRPVQLGLLPRHLYLVGKLGAAIESTLDYGITLSSAYRSRAIMPEQKALAAHSIFAVHLLNLGKSAVDRGHLERAEAILNLARDLLPDNPRAYLHLGQIHQRRGELEDAAKNYYRVYSLYPMDPRGYNHLRFQAWERMARGQYAEAETLFRRMNDAQPDDIDVLRGLEMAYHRMKRPKAAEEIAQIRQLMEEEF